MSTSADDDVAAKSGFLCMYMSSHPDTLTAYIKYQGGVAGAVSAPKLEAINTKNMTLSYIPGKTKTGDRKQVVVAFKPPLSGYNEVKGRMLGMKADAQEALGMVRLYESTCVGLDNSNNTDQNTEVDDISTSSESSLARHHYVACVLIPCLPSFTHCSKNHLGQLAWFYAPAYIEGY